MPKRKEPRREIIVQLPEKLAAEVDVLLWNPVRGKVKYGARSDLISELLRRWVSLQTQETVETVKGQVDAGS